MKRHVLIARSLIQALSISAALAGCAAGPSDAPAIISGQNSQQPSATKAEPENVFSDHRQEFRDISFARFLNGRWGEPQSLHDDRWEINGRPVNGPVFAVDENRLAVVWFTAAKDILKVKISFSENAGETFGGPVEVDEGKPAGRADVVLAGKDGAVVRWVERGEKGPQILVRRVGSDGRRSPASIVWTSER